MLDDYVHVSNVSPFSCDLWWTYFFSQFISALCRSLFNNFRDCSKLILCFIELYGNCSGVSMYVFFFFEYASCSINKAQHFSWFMQCLYFYPCGSPVSFSLFSKQFFSTCEWGVQDPWTICFHRSLGPPLTARVLCCCRSLQFPCFSRELVHHPTYIQRRWGWGRTNWKMQSPDGQCLLSSNPLLRCWNVNN